MRAALQWVANQFHVMLRSVDYVHWDDPVVVETLENFDGAFISTAAEPIPQRLLGRMAEGPCRCVFLMREMAARGLPSIDLLPAIHVQKLLDHLEQLGHRNIACFNIQSAAKRTVIERVEQWNLWRHAHHFDGQFIDAPLPPYQETFDRVHEQFKAIYTGGSFNATALFCTTMSAAIGAMRAFHEAGVRVGRDVSICAVDDLGLARCLVPSVTSLYEPDPIPFMSAAMEWIVNREKGWVGSLLLEAKDPPMYIGESTRPVASSARARVRK